MGDLAQPKRRGGRRRRRDDKARAPGETGATEEREGVVTLQFRTDQPVPTVPRGAYFKTPPRGSSIRCFAYASPFLYGEFKGWRVTGLEPWFLIDRFAKLVKN